MWKNENLQDMPNSAFLAALPYMQECPMHDPNLRTPPLPLRQV